jgi:hypothetical protein
MKGNSMVKGVIIYTAHFILLQMISITPILTSDILIEDFSSTRLRKKIGRSKAYKR